MDIQKKLKTPENIDTMKASTEQFPTSLARKHASVFDLLKEL